MPSRCLTLSTVEEMSPGGREIGDAWHVRESDDAAVVEGLADLNEDTIEEFLEGLVEGDLVIDDAEVHAFHRKLLDDLRRDVDNLMNPTLTSLS